MGATKHNEGKRQWTLLDFKSLEGLVDVLTMGATKYSLNNWKKGLKTTEVADALLRHLTAYLSGETHDPESGLSHTAHIQCNAMFMAHYEGTEWDNRHLTVDKAQLKLMLDDMGHAPFTPVKPELVSFQELCNLSMRKATQIDLVRDLVGKYSNDEELGAAIRNTIIGAE